MVDFLTVNLVKYTNNIPYMDAMDIARGVIIFPIQTMHYY